MVAKTIKKLSNQLSRVLDHSPELKADNNVTGMQRWVIGYLAHGSKGDVYQKDIEKEFDIRRSTASGILRLMEENGLIKREPVSTDARLKKIVLTEKAKQFHQKIEVEVVKMEHIVTDSLTKEEVDVFLAVADKISHNLEEFQTKLEKQPATKLNTDVRK